jgi:hypothetical protein
VRCITYHHEHDGCHAARPALGEAKVLWFQKRDASVNGSGRQALIVQEVEMNSQGWDFALVRVTCR